MLLDCCVLVLFVVCVKFVSSGLPIWVLWRRWHLFLAAPSINAKNAKEEREIIHPFGLDCDRLPEWGFCRWRLHKWKQILISVLRGFSSNPQWWNLRTLKLQNTGTFGKFQAETPRGRTILDSLGRRGLAQKASSYWAGFALSVLAYRPHHLLINSPCLEYENRFILLLFLCTFFLKWES